MRRIAIHPAYILALVLLNLGLLAWMAFAPRQERFGGPPPAHEVLDFDDAQFEQFHALVREHEQAMRAKNEEQKTQLKAFFGPLTGAGTEARKEQAAQTVLELERDKLGMIYAHFEEVRSLLRPDQQERFGEFLDEVLNMGRGPQRGPHSPRRGGPPRR